MKLTRADRKILEILQQDSSVTNVSELAERVGLSPSPCLRRVKAAGGLGPDLRLCGVARTGARRRLDLRAYVEVRSTATAETAAEAFADAVRREPVVVGTTP